MKRVFIGLAAIVLAVVAAPVLATPEFPPLSGRVVDQANVIPADVERELSDKLQALEAATTDQVVVATFPSLQGYEIEEFGYLLGRRWGIGTEKDNGAILIVAPKERKVRIEVGYGLEPVLTDAVSSTIIQGRIIPRFKAGDLPGGIVQGTDAIIEILQKPPGEAQEMAAQTAVSASRGGASPWPFVPLFPLLFFLFVFLVLSRLGRRRRRGGGFGGVLPWIVLSTLESASRHSGRGSGWSGGGGRWSGGGGFSGGGGSFGGGGASGSW